MDKKILVMSFAVIMSLKAFSADAALSSTALLSFDTGSQVCDSSGLNCTMLGSYFSVDTDNDGAFTAYESIGISPGMDGGILIGQAQPAPNGSPSYPNGTEITGIDAAWAFLGSTGMHQTTSPVNIISDNGSGVVQLDFSGFSASWSVINNINLGGSSAYASENGQATLKCGFDCSVGDSFILDYAAHVPLDDPNFADIYWGLHLQGTVLATPVPAAIWLFGSGLIGLAGFARCQKAV